MDNVYKNNHTPLLLNKKLTVNKIVNVVFILIIRYFIQLNLLQLAVNTIFICNSIEYIKIVVVLINNRCAFRERKKNIE